MLVSGFCHSHFWISFLKVNLEFFSAHIYYVIFGTFLHGQHWETITDIKNPLWQDPDNLLLILFPKNEDDLFINIGVMSSKSTEYFSS